MEQEPTTTANTFVKLMRTDDAEQLIATHPNTFLLLSLIAIRSRRHLDQCKWTGLSQNQAFIGDHKSCGLSEQEYRTAKLALTKLGIATFKGTNKGTISTLCDASIYDINPESINGQDNSPITNQQRTNNEPATTKKNVNNSKNVNKEGVNTLSVSFSPESPTPKTPRKRLRKSFVPPTKEEALAWAKAEGHLVSQVDKAWEYYSRLGWKDSRGTPVKAWKQKFLAVWLSPEQVEQKQELRSNAL